MSSNILEISNLHKRFGDVEVLKGVDCAMQQGDVVCIIGSSGSSADVTSSNSISLGSMAMARAIATRCCWPPDSWPG